MGFHIGFRSTHGDPHGKDPSWESEKLEDSRWLEWPLHIHRLGGTSVHMVQRYLKVAVTKQVTTHSLSGFSLLSSFFHSNSQWIFRKRKISHKSVPDYAIMKTIGSSLSPEKSLTWETQFVVVVLEVHLHSILIKDGTCKPTHHGSMKSKLKTQENWRKRT